MPDPVPDPAAPVVSTANASPKRASTVVGMGFLGTVLTSVSANGLPVDKAGWFSLGLQTVMGLAAIFMKG